MLPRLLYLGDVPVEAAYHGRLYLYRLLERYPADRLRILEAGLLVSQPARRLAGVRYEDRRPPLVRLARTRFAPLYWSTLQLLARTRARRLARVVRDFRPEAILSVAQGLSCVTAAGLADEIGVPLHLICHDDWHLESLHGGAADGRDLFGAVYRGAASRLCISPAAVETFEGRYGARGSVLYPIRSADGLGFNEPPERLARPSQGLTCAFAGTVANKATVAALRRLAGRLLPLGGRLLVFGPLRRAAAEALGLTAANVEFDVAPSTQDLIEALRARADVLFVPMSFAEEDRDKVAISFPSKLADYTAAGLPILIHGPAYCSAVRWAQANQPVAEVVTSEEDDALSRALRRLADEPSYRVRLAQAAISTGRRDFSHHAVYDAFKAALGRGYPGASQRCDESDVVNVSRLQA